ncbi:recombinase family protein [Streptomyces gobiensis]|uniref:recombinase family protein n=1 Tax=Streptomyces gobiensis TaxID=2875706 RepID=UPI001E37AC95|nr:recombinase family protein [Streptomyces gobiensis]UGY93412.1 recombinase family protein [Streptomyces gobiensis]
MTPYADTLTAAPAPATVPALLTGRQYLRASQDKRGRGDSVESQSDANREGAAQHYPPITITGTYTDNNIGAWKRKGKSRDDFKGKSRDDFERLMSDLESDAFTDDVLVIFESARGSRRAGEWCTLIDLLEEKGKRVYVTTHGRLYDPSNNRDRRTLQEDAVDAEYAGGKISEGVQRGVNKAAKQGRPYGKCPYGYRPVYDSRNGKLINWEPDPTPAARGDKSWSGIIAELFNRLAKAHTLYAIAADFKARGILNKGEKRGGKSGSGKPKPFSPEQLREIAQRVVYAEYPDDKDKGKGTRNHRGTLYKGTWPALVSKGVFDEVQRRLNDPKRRTSDSGQPKHELGRILRCGYCRTDDGEATPLSVRSRNGGIFVCPRGCVEIKKDPVDMELIGTAEKPGMVLRYLASDAVYRDFSATPKDEAKAEAAEDRIKSLRAELGELEDWRPRKPSEIEYKSQAIDDMRAEIRGLEAQTQALRMPAVLAELKPGPDIAKRWAAAPLSVRRTVLRLLLTPEVLGETRVMKGRGVPVGERIVVRYQ